MSGKAYTMKEMKAIVDYLTEHRAYSEIRGRKMWTECANSKITNRTWQSLKETFLKRILPDIHNPYYKLTLHQITSFRQGYDLEAKLKNKLEVRPVHENANSNAVNNKDIEHPSTSNDKNGENVTGEEPKVVSDHRDSTDTLVLENCYETAEDIQRDLSSPNTEEQGKQVTSSAKSLRDMIEYEPMTPMLQKLIDDFATDEDEGSDKEPRMEIDEDAGKKNENTENLPIEISDSEEQPVSGDVKNDNEVHIEKTSDKTSSEQINTKTITEDPDIENEVSSSDNNVQKDEKIIPSTNGDITSVNTANNINNSNTAEIVTQNHSNTTTDTLLPNNQEELDTEPSKKDNSKPTSNSQKLSMKRKSKKRLISTEIKAQNSKKKALEIEQEKLTSNSLQLNQAEDTPNNIAPSVEETKVTKPKQSTPTKLDKPVKIAQESTDHTYNADNEKSTEKIPSSIDNPCLKSVNLYEEQFSNIKYSDSENSNNDVPKYAQHIPEGSKKQEHFENECVVLKSHSESESEDEVQRPKKTSRSISSKRQRDKSLANIFGFASGAVSGRRQRASHRQSITRLKTVNISSGSSEWTSDTACEFVSPPRGRKNRHGRKYLKPKSARILSLEEEGGLFVMYGKKIYPIVKDGKVIKNYVNYSPDNASEEEETRWKIKYLEEKKRTAELTRLLKEVKEQNNQTELNRVSSLPSVLSNSESSSTKQEEVKNAQAKNQPSKDGVKESLEEKTLKIKVSDHDKEIQLEGHWSHINPVLEQVIQLLHKQPDPPSNCAKSKTENEVSEAASRVSTPVIEIDEVKENVDRRERAIFQEIEEDARREADTPKKKQSHENVTKRKANISRKNSAASLIMQSPAKKTKVEEEGAKQDVRGDGEEAGPVSTRRQARAQREGTHDNSDDVSKPITRTRKSMTKKAKEVTAENFKSMETEEDADIRYKFPSPPPSASKTRRNSKNKKNSPQQKTYTRYMTRSKLRSSGDFVIPTDNRHDLDTNPLHLFKGEKRKLRFSSSSSDIKINNPQTNNLNITEDLTGESSNSYQNGLSQSVTFHNSTISTEIYRSESYQMLMPHSKNISRNLEKIEENSQFEDENKLQDYTLPSNEMKNIDYRDTEEHSEQDCLSNTSLPTSPVLSIVENLSLNKNLLNSADDFPIYEDEMHNATDHIMLNDLMKCDVDVSMPLMEQECGIVESGHIGREYHYNLNTPGSELLINKLCKVNIDDQTISDSVNARLHNLLLDSNKKKKDIAKDEQGMTDKELKDNGKSKKTRKRSSTPRKRQTTRKTRFTSLQPSIEEEHTENCSISRMSCPPVMQFSHISADVANEICDVIEVNNNLIKSDDTNIAKTKVRLKKDVIKVKIPRVKSIKGKMKSLSTIETKSSQANNCSNDTESSVLLQELNDSVDLIHNHSETCLHAHECVGEEDDVEILEDSTRSIISLNSSSKHSHKSDHSNGASIQNLVNKVAQEFICSNAQDKIIQFPGSKVFGSPSATVYHTPIASLSSANSLITEDLSSDIPDVTTHNTKWYLLSEEETTNTDYFDANHNPTKADVGYGANLNQIFPITCAVPDLSTITEMSKENDESTRNTCNDTFTRSNFDSPNLFNNCL